MVGAVEECKKVITVIAYLMAADFENHVWPCGDHQCNAGIPTSCLAYFLSCNQGSI